MSDEEEVEQTLADLEYWNELARRLGWRTMGFTYRSGVTYVTKNKEGYENTVTLTGSQRDDIMRALDNV